MRRWTVAAWLGAFWMAGLLPLLALIGRVEGTTLFSVALFAFVLSSALALLVYLAVERPIRRLSGAIHRFAEGDLEQPVPTTRSLPFGGLVRALDSMRVRLRAATNELRDSRQQMEQLVAERTGTLRRRAEQLRTINNVGRRMVTLRNLDDLLPFVAGELVRAFKFENVNICLVDDEPDILVVRAAAGVYGKLPLGSRFEVGQQGIIGSVAGSSEPLIVNDVRADSRYILVEALRDTAAEMAVQIRHGDQFLGVLDVESRELDAFDETDLSTAQTLADLIAVAIENARLYEQSRELAVTEERNRLAREIHDTLAQGLTGLSLQLELADETLDREPEQARQAIQRALSLTRLNLEEARRSVMNLRSRSLQQRSLPDAIRHILEQYGRESGFYFSFRHSIDDELPPATEAGLFRVVQEAIVNIARHAQASEVNVDLVNEGDRLVLTVDDDGVGFDPDSYAAMIDGIESSASGMPPGHFGLVGMQERVHLLGGTIHLSSSPGDGTRLQVEIPVRLRDRV